MPLAPDAQSAASLLPAPACLCAFKYVTLLNKQVLEAAEVEGNFDWPCHILLPAPVCNRLDFCTRGTLHSKYSCR